MNVLQYKHIIWDWNGTLLNDTWLCVEVLNGMLHNRNMQLVTYDSYRDLFSFPVIDYYRSIGFDLSKEPFDKLGTEFISEYEKRRFECELQSEAVDVLERIANAGIAQSILSAYEHKMLESMVKHFNVVHYFDAIKGLADYSAASKIDNGRGLFAELGIDAKEILIVGDTVHDYEVANALGTDCLLVSSGHHHRDKLETCGVNVVDALGEVIK